VECAGLCLHVSFKLSHFIWSKKIITWWFTLFMLHYTCVDSPWHRKPHTWHNCNGKVSSRVCLRKLPLSWAAHVDVRQRTNTRLSFDSWEYRYLYVLQNTLLLWPKQDMGCRNLQYLYWQNFGLELHTKENLVEKRHKWEDYTKILSNSYSGERLNCGPLDMIRWQTASQLRR